MKRIAVLGSTGSIGIQTLDVCRRLGLEVTALTGMNNIALLEQQAREFRPRMVVTGDDKQYGSLKQAMSDVPGIRVLGGREGLLEAAGLMGSDIVVNAVVGIAGLPLTLAAARKGVRLALANKESLVAGGKLVMDAVERTGAELIPVDSEHSAIFQCLVNAPGREVKKLILTASGGPFFGKAAEELKDVKAKDALRHPTWNMGSKITVDSATLMNKGLEFIEAAWLFGRRPEEIDIVVHRESIIHSMVEFVDGAILAQLGMPDMRVPIQYAITYPNRIPSAVNTVDFPKIGSLTFFKPDYTTFTCLRACMDAYRKGGLSPCFANGANEEAVALFLQDKISFLQIGQLVAEAVSSLRAGEADSLEAVLEADAAAREFVRSHTARG